MESGNCMKFVTFKSCVDPSFWHKLYHLKLEQDKLNENVRQIRGFYLTPDDSSFSIDCSSFNKEYEDKFGKNEFTSIKYLCDKEINYRTFLLYAPGYLINFNTAYDFKNSNKNSIMKEYGQIIKKDIETGLAIDNPILLTKFILVTFANLKSFEFIYWFGFPSLSSQSYKFLSQPKFLKDVFSEAQLSDLLESHQSLPDNNKTVFAVMNVENKLACLTLREYFNYLNESPDDVEKFICFIDPSRDEKYPGWPLRNILALINFHCKDRKPINVICLRIGNVYKTSMVMEVQIDEVLEEEIWVGWETNLRDKNGPRCSNLKSSLDSTRLADSAADLNLKLIKWRMSPDLNLDIIKSQKCLLLGAGTLGCSVARSLIGWGIRHITFVDNGRVSFSNPVRQSLYNFTDCSNDSKKCKLKATVAAEAVKQILPAMNSSGVIFDIPMPGHHTATVENAEKLHNLIEEHDVIFLLTDSRESRWLPALICNVLNKLAFTVALGFESYLVIRHGQNKTGGDKLGCYFCNDITAPGNTMEDRSLDLQCTVTRPGLSQMAAACAVELFTSLLQHPMMGEASSSEKTVLGNLPHSVRGYIADFSVITPSTPSFMQCIACSPVIEKTYLEDRVTFLESAFNSKKYLEDLTGLTELYSSTESLELFVLSDGFSDSDGFEAL